MSGNATQDIGDLDVNSSKVLRDFESVFNTPEYQQEQKMVNDVYIRGVESETNFNFYLRRSRQVNYRCFFPSFLLSFLKFAL